MTCCVPHPDDPSCPELLITPPIRHVVLYLLSHVANLAIVHLVLYIPLGELKSVELVSLLLVVILISYVANLAF